MQKNKNYLRYEYTRSQYLFIAFLHAKQYHPTKITGVSNIKDRYQILGNGQEKVLVLHGFFASTASYQPLYPYLNQDKFTYAFFDLRGYGRSKNIKGHYTLEEITQDCLELAEHLNWNAFHVIGHSMTGLAIQHLNAIKPHTIKTATVLEQRNPLLSNCFFI